VSGIDLVWSSSDTTVATVSSTGLVTALDLGDAMVSVDVDAGSGDARARISHGLSGDVSRVVGTRSSGASRSFRVHSHPKLVLIPANDTVNVGDTVAYTVVATTASGKTPWPTPSTTWASSLQSVASIGAGGLAAGLASGTTTITATTQIITRGKAHTYVRSVPLTVEDCAGFTSVTTWDLAISVTYNPAAITIGPTTWSVNQASTASATLMTGGPSGGPGAFNDDHVWWHVLTGTGSINNSESTTAEGATYISTEEGSGSLDDASLSKDAIAELGVHRDLLQSGIGAPSCSYMLAYADVMPYTETSPEGEQNAATGPLGLTYIRAEIPSGVHYAPGVVLDSTLTIKAVVSDANRGMAGGPDISDYVPFTEISGGVPDLATTTASVHYTLTAH
jgi:hypothetical protein